MLDRLFLSRLNSTGKKAYWLGQIGLVISLFVILFGFMSYDFEEAEAPLIGGIIAVVVVWGLVCLAIWPAGKQAGARDWCPACKRRDTRKDVERCPLCGGPLMSGPPGTQVVNG